MNDDRKHNGHEDQKHLLTILTLGDGDFSWSVDLATYLAGGVGMRKQRVELIATGVDSRQALQNKYKNIESLLRELQRIGDCNKNSISVEVHHEVNALYPQDNILAEKTADIVIFNHPHLGTEDARRHASFLSHLFYTVRETWMNNNTKAGHLYITLASGQFERWKCDAAAQRHGFVLVERLRFVSQGIVENARYEHRRHQTGKSFRSRTDGSYTYRYALLASSSSPKIHFPWFQPLGTDCNVTQESLPPQPPPAPFACPHCDRSFAQDRWLQQHMQAKHNHTTTTTPDADNTFLRSWSCPCCDRTFTSAEGLRDHQQAKHTGLHTGRILPSWAAAATTEDTTTTTTEDGSTARCCPICSAPLLGTMDDHVQQWLVPALDSHGADKRAFCSFNCTFCSKSFASERAQWQHENFCAARLGVKERERDLASS